MDPRRVGDAMDPIVDRLAKLLAAASLDSTDHSGTRRSVIFRSASVFTSTLAALASGSGAGEAQERMAEAEGTERPGRYSRKAGVESWRVNRKPGGVVVTFEHRNRRLSGQVDITYGGRGQTLTFALTNNGGRFQLAFSGTRIAGTTDSGKRFTASAERNGRGVVEWNTAANSRQVARGSANEFLIGLSIAADLAPRSHRQSQRASISGENAEDQVSGRQIDIDCSFPGDPKLCCSLDDEVYGTNWDRGALFRELGEDEAYRTVSEDCSAMNGCQTCCDTACGSVCEPFFGSDLLCIAWCFGYPFPRRCT